MKNQSRDRYRTFQLREEPHDWDVVEEGVLPVLLDPLTARVRLHHGAQADAREALRFERREEGVHPQRARVRTLKHLLAQLIGELAHERGAVSFLLRLYEIAILRRQEEVDLAEDSGPGLKGSIGEGQNHSNFSDRSSVRILSKNLIQEFSLENY